jgi:hypothetical protein
VGISDKGPKLQALCDHAAQQAESVLGSVLDAAPDGGPDLHDLERALGRVVRNAFRTARGIKPNVICILTDTPAASEDLAAQ